MIRTIHYSIVFSILAMMLAAPTAMAQATNTTEASAGTTAPEAVSEVVEPWPGLSLQIAVLDADNKLSPGDNVQLRLDVANFGEVQFPGSILTIGYQGIELEANQVELPFLEPEEGLDFTIGAQMAADASTADVAFTVYFERVNENGEAGEELKAINFSVLNGEIVDPEAKRKFALGTDAAALAAAVAGTDGVTDAATGVTPVVEEEEPIGRLIGEVLDLATARPHANELVALEQQMPSGVTDAPHKVTTTTDANGSFQIDLPAGEYLLRIYKGDEIERTELGVEVKANLARRLDYVVGEDPDTSVEEYVVTTNAEKAKASIQLVIRKKAAVVTDNLSAEEFSKAGDSDAGDAAQRSVGVSVLGGRYLYVRGLFERYNYAMVDGVRLPSPDPDKRIVPLDIFPTSVLVGMSIVKTASPDMSPDFGGGVVNMETVKFPEERFCKLGLGTGINTRSTFQDRNSYAGGSLDALGFDDGTRAFPSNLPNDGSLISVGTYDADEVDLASKQFNNDFTFSQKTALPKISASATCGGQYSRGVRQLGYLAYVGYKHKEQIREELRSRWRGVDVASKDVGTLLSGTTGQRSVSLTGLVNVSYKPSTLHLFNLTSFVMNKASDNTRFLSGQEQNFNGSLDYLSLRFERRTLWFNKLSGEHLWPALEFDWFASSNLAMRDEPDWREFVRTQEDNSAKQWLVKSSSGQHFFSGLDENSNSFGLNFAKPFDVWADGEAKLRFGGAATLRDREFDVRRFRFTNLQNVQDGFFELPADQIFTDANIGTSIRMQESTRPNDDYSGKERNYAGYALIDLPLVSKLRLITGVRYEYSLVTLIANDPFDATKVVEPALENNNILPSVNLVYALNEEQNLRASFSKTVARPDFQEIAPFSLAAFYGGAEKRGNPDLKQTEIYNFDVRWEWFPEEGEVISATAFVKRFINHIENTFIQNTIMRPENLPTPSLAYGLELEAQQRFNEAKGFWKNTYVGGNITLLNSVVDLTNVPGLQTTKERAMQGMSPFTFNARIGYDNGTTIVQATYRVNTRYLANVGTQGAPDIFGLPFHDLSMTLAHTFKEDWKFSASIDNLANDAFEQVLFEDDTLASRTYTGIDFDLGLSYEF